MAYRGGEVLPLQREVSVEHSEEEVVLRLHNGRELQLELVVEEGWALPRHHLRRGRPQEGPRLLGAEGLPQKGEGSTVHSHISTGP